MTGIPIGNTKEITEIAALKSASFVTRNIFFYCTYLQSRKFYVRSFQNCISSNFFILEYVNKIFKILQGLFFFILHILSTFELNWGKRYYFYFILTFAEPFFTRLCVI